MTTGITLLFLTKIKHNSEELGLTQNISQTLISPCPPTSRPELKFRADSESPLKWTWAMRLGIHSEAG
jgi:hypothetical protein